MLMDEKDATRQAEETRLMEFYSSTRDMIVIDTETTGVSPNPERDPDNPESPRAIPDEILQLSIIDGKGNVLLDTYVKPEHHTEWPAAEAVNHITPEMVQDAPSFSEIRDQVQRIFDETRMVVGYNVDFDLEFLEAAGIQKPDHMWRTDVMEWFAGVYQEKDTNRDDYKWQKLTTCSSYYGFDYEALYGKDSEHAHSSLYDARATLFCYGKLRDEEIKEYLYDLRRDAKENIGYSLNFLEFTGDQWKLQLDRRGSELVLDLARRLLRDQAKKDGMQDYDEQFPNLAMTFLSHTNRHLADYTVEKFASEPYPVVDLAALIGCWPNSDTGIMGIDPMFGYPADVMLEIMNCCREGIDVTGLLNCEGERDASEFYVLDHFRRCGVDMDILLHPPGNKAFSFDQGLAIFDAMRTNTKFALRGEAAPISTDLFRHDVKPLYLRMLVEAANRHVDISQFHQNQTGQIYAYLLAKRKGVDADHAAAANLSTLGTDLLVSAMSCNQMQENQQKPPIDISAFGKKLFAMQNQAAGIVALSALSAYLKDRREISGQIEVSYCDEIKSDEIRLLAEHDWSHLRTKGQVELALKHTEKPVVLACIDGEMTNEELEQLEKFISKKDLTMKRAAVFAKLPLEEKREYLTGDKDVSSLRESIHRKITSAGAKEVQAKAQQQIRKATGDRFIAFSTLDDGIHPELKMLPMMSEYKPDMEDLPDMINANNLTAPLESAKAADQMTVHTEAFFLQPGKDAEVPEISEIYLQAQYLCGGKQMLMQKCQQVGFDVMEFTPQDLVFDPKEMLAACEKALSGHERKGVQSMEHHEAMKGKKKQEAR